MVSKSEFQDEIDRFKRAANTPLTIMSRWQPIAMSWVEKWKLYVNFDMTEPEPRDAEVSNSFFSRSKQ